MIILWSFVLFATLVNKNGGVAVTKTNYIYLPGQLKNIQNHVSQGPALCVA